MKGGGAQDNDEELLDAKQREWNIKTIETRKVPPVPHATSLFDDRSISPHGM
jgi:hypothetical protein